MGVNPNLSRRTFLTWYMAGLMTATVVAGLLPILVFIWPPPPPNQKNTDVKAITDDPLSQLADGDATRFASPQNGGFIMQDGGGDNAKGDVAYSGYAVKQGGKTLFFAVNCSHLGCSVNWVKESKHFECPCHGSRFNPDGTVQHGPAAYPLSHLKATTQGDNLLVAGFIETAGAS